MVNARARASPSAERRDFFMTRLLVKRAFRMHRIKSGTQASQQGLSSWFFSTIFPNCRFLFLDCFWVAVSRRTRALADEECAIFGKSGDAAAWPHIGGAMP